MSTTEIVMPGTTTDYVRSFARALSLAWPCDHHRMVLEDVYMGVEMTLVDVEQEQALYTIVLGATEPTDAELEVARTATPAYERAIA